MSRFKNVGLWLSIAALIPMICKGFNINILPSNYNDIVNAFLSILVLLGIVSNPSIGPGYTDTTKTPTDITNEVK